VCLVQCPLLVMTTIMMTMVIMVMIIVIFITMIISLVQCTLLCITLVRVVVDTCPQLLRYTTPSFCPFPPRGLIRLREFRREMQYCKIVQQWRMSVVRNW